MADIYNNNKSKLDLHNEILSLHLCERLQPKIQFIYLFSCMLPSRSDIELYFVSQRFSLNAENCISYYHRFNC